MSKEGLKFDNGKLRWDLLPIETIEEVVKVLTMGANKYAPNNWQLVEDAKERYYAAMLRHIVEWRRGNTTDDESGLNHLSHAMCNMVFLLWFDNNKNKQLE